MNRSVRTGRRWVAALLVAATVACTAGCATLAHRSSVSGHRVRTTSNCAGEGDVCPWLIGDALLLLPGIIPGVIAFAVDFGTGAWRHTGYADAGRPADGVAVAEAQEDHP
jgi:hypothetical protein